MAVLAGQLARKSQITVTDSQLLGSDLAEPLPRGNLPPGAPVKFLLLAGYGRMGRRLTVLVSCIADITTSCTDAKWLTGNVQLNTLHSVRVNILNPSLMSPISGYDAHVLISINSK